MLKIFFDRLRCLNCINLNRDRLARGKLLILAEFRRRVYVAGMLSCTLFLFDYFLWLSQVLGRHDRRSKQISPGANHRYSAQLRASDEVLIPTLVSMSLVRFKYTDCLYGYGSYVLSGYDLRSEANFS